MKVANSLKYALIVIGLLAASLVSGWLMSKAERYFCRDCDAARSDTIVLVDTVFIDRPIVKDSVIVKTVARYLKVHDTLIVSKTIVDSVFVEVPITRKVYGDSLYTAWVSGYEPRLDSIEIYQRSVIIKEKKRRFSFGIQAGYGMTTKGFAPYVGVGVGYNLPP